MSILALTVVDQVPGVVAKVNRHKDSCAGTRASAELVVMLSRDNRREDEDGGNRFVLIVRTSVICR